MGHAIRSLCHMAFCFHTLANWRVCVRTFHQLQIHVEFKRLIVSQLKQIV